MKNKTHVAYELDYTVESVRYEESIACECESVAEIAVAALLLDARALRLLPRRCLQLFRRRLLGFRFHFGTAIRHLRSDRLAQHRLPLVLHRCNTPSLLMFITSLEFSAKSSPTSFYRLPSCVIFCFTNSKYKVPN